MRLISWNVNGIRAILKKNFMDFVKEQDPDILCLQETKAHPEQVNIQMDGYHAYWDAAIKRGYSGTAVFSKTEPENVSRGIGKKDHDTEGRVITADYDDFYLVNVYAPNSGDGLRRLDYRTNEWDVEFRKYLNKLKRKKGVVVCGDMNVAHQEIDLARPDGNHQSAGFTDEEREQFGKLLKAGFIDSFREFNKEGGHYTWWSYRTRGRERNVGWRIDYFLVSKDMRPRLKSAGILSDVMGSDHCPVEIVLD